MVLEKLNRYKQKNLQLRAVELEVLDSHSSREYEYVKALPVRPLHNSGEGPLTFAEK